MHISFVQYRFYIPYDVPEFVDIRLYAHVVGMECRYVSVNHVQIFDVFDHIWVVSDRAEACPGCLGSVADGIDGVG